MKKSETVMPQPNQNVDTRPPRPSKNEIRQMEPGRLYWATVTPIWEKISIYDGARVFLKQFKQVNEPQGLLMAAHWCESEICNGGHDQFFDNSTGILAPEAIQGFKMIGMKKAANIVSKAVDLFGKPYPRNREKRQNRLGALWRPSQKTGKRDPFDLLDQAFFKIAHSPDCFENQADNFVRNNMELFFR